MRVRDLTKLQSARGFGLPRRFKLCLIGALCWASMGIAGLSQQSIPPLSAGPVRRLDTNTQPSKVLGEVDSINSESLLRALMSAVQQPPLISSKTNTFGVKAADSVAAFLDKSLGTEIYRELAKTNAEVRQSLQEHLLAALRLERQRLERALQIEQMELKRLGDQGQIQTEAFEWNASQSKFIFWVAHLLLLIALGTALFEFVHAFHTRQASRRDKDHIDINLEGIALKTSLRGIYILMTAVGIYLLYIKFVYTLTPVGS